MSARNDSFLERVENWFYQHIVWNISLWIRDPKRYYMERRAIKRFPPGTIIEDCRYRPAIILENDQGNLTCWDMCEGGLSECALFHCGIEKLRPDYAFELVRKWRAGEMTKETLYPDYTARHPGRYADGMHRD
ncbi:hypothetical protein CFR75_07145 [Komagataeibacter xylinus]|uniref:Uncharacterized protein n=1 Tax=Komagataeibacter xylinus TaxID=28448 RepID=A0A318PQ15_KOMXY|nr:hypothetical protein [Komagataeibacter xylinus]PYD57178.1 hypothetical protein CFR75_07145 [Komagataeibacter xylinus]GBQ79379.1 hypothetical protein AA15237_2910 [Komagataeibacter xylinus NBRC 15237]